MKIEQSGVSLFSSHKKSNEVVENESLEMWDSSKTLSKNGDRLLLSEEYKNFNKNGMQGVQELSDEQMLDPKLMSIVRTLEALTGQKINIAGIKKEPSTTNLTDGRVGWGIRYTKERSEISDEALTFSASGNIKSQDGKSIDFALAFEMKSHTQLYESTSFKAGDALIDPLVLNFGADTVTISNMKKDFDLNMDGKNEQFSFVGEGSGFLALDKNSDGIINNGSELFGPTKGNGFAELSAYDGDKNGWIDENDTVFEKLLIWTKDSSGAENLYSLKEKNVGALYLGKTDTQFDIKNGAKMEAFLKESSIYAKEDGSGVGTLQEVDLVV